VSGWRAEPFSPDLRAVAAQSLGCALFLAAARAVFGFRRHNLVFERMPLAERH